MEPRLLHNLNECGRAAGRALPSLPAGCPGATEDRLVECRFSEFGLFREDLGPGILVGNAAGCNGRGPEWMPEVFEEGRISAQGEDEAGARNRKYSRLSGVRVGGAKFRSRVMTNSACFASL